MAARAQVGIEQAPTRSVFAPGSGIADGAEPWGVVVNPASLGSLPGWTLGLRDTETSATTPFSGRGTGVYFATPLPGPRLAEGLVDLSWLSRIQLGAALEVLRPPQQAAAGTSARLALSLSASPLPWLALGLSYGHLFVPSSTAYDGLNTLDLGARLRFGPHLAAGLVLRDVTAPGLGSGHPLERVYEAELLGLPLADDRLELAAGARIGELYADAEPRVRLWLRPRPGLAVGADFTLLAGAPSPPSGLAYRVAAGVQIDFGRAGASAFPQFSAPSGLAGPASLGGSLAARLSKNAYPSLLTGPRYLLEVRPGRGEARLRLLQRLREMEEDPQAAGVLVHLMPEGAPRWAAARELREQLLRLRRVGKHVYAFAEFLDSAGLFVASAAERTFAHPAGRLYDLGVAQSALNFKDLLDRLGVRAEYLALGEYKLLENPYGASQPPPTAHETYQALVDHIYQHLIAGVAGGRSLPEARVREVVDQGMLTPEEARDAGLVDDLASEEQMRSTLWRSLGRAVAIVSDAPERPSRRVATPPAIVVVQIQGTLAGSQHEGVTIIREAASDPQVRALVLRIDSPGGESLGMDNLSKAIAEARQRKPVLCSLGEEATSAAYGIAVECDRIFTDALTSTGHIGVWWLHIDVGGLLRRLGVRRTTWSRGKNADMARHMPQPSFLPLPGEITFQSYTEAERARAMVWLQSSYDRFVDQVTAGRRLPRARVAELARGRLWIGETAVEYGLCDQIPGSKKIFAFPATHLASPIPAREGAVLTQALPEVL